jgi:hypothetical protein
MPFVANLDTEFDPTEYKWAIGGLCWLADATRPDIAYTISLPADSQQRQGSGISYV